MLTQYTNTKDISNNGPDTMFRFSMTDYGVLNKNLVSVNDISSAEVHFYLNDTWITGNHSVGITETAGIYSFDIKKVLADLKLSTGKFRFIVNFFRNTMGEYDRQYLYVSDISPDRTELMLKWTSDSSAKELKEYTNYIDLYESVPQTAQKTFKQYLLNFSQNKTFAYVNSVVVGDSFYIKLLNPLPVDIKLNFKCWVVEEVKSPFTDNVALTTTYTPKTFNKLNNPNWQANTNSINASSDSSLKNWNDLLGSSVQTSQQIVDTYFSGSLEGVALNIDYRDFNNFIFYSSAAERLHNFKYKLELLEYYNSQINTLSLVPGTIATTNIADYTANKTNLISGFDSFEKYLYYESSSLLYNNDYPIISPSVESITGSYVFPAPKTNSTKPYTLTSTTSSLFTTWYDNLIVTASLYDDLNINRLTNTIPNAIKFDENNDQLITFVNMLGHHYDILHAYIKQASLIYKREENPKLGIPNELLFDVAKQFGWNLAEGNQYQDLWAYTLGTDQTGAPLTGSNSVGDPSVSSKNMTYAVWRRIVNNLPLLLKSKGTKRSVQALLSCYGIPQSMISINEYGGPRIERAPVYEKVNFDYSLDLINNAAGTVTINYNTPISGLELRFRTDDVVSNPLLPSAMNLVTIGSNTVSLHFDSGNMGKIKINGTASANIELYDGKWLNMLLQKNGTKLDLFVKKSKYGKIVATVSSSATASFASTGTITLGGTTGGSRLYGQLQELRLWTGSLNMSAFANHTKAPSAYDGNTDVYEELLFRLPLTQKINHALTSSLTGVQPKSSSMSASFSSWTNNIPYDSLDEIHYFDGISMAVGTLDDNKVRIESSELSSNRLDLLKRVEISQYDAAPLDSNKLGVYFSPQTMINEDIIAQLGFTELDSYIGDPSIAGRDSYPLLEKQARLYWKKYLDKNDINSYIRMFTMFDMSFFKQLDQLLPARAEKITGLLIQPNLLERNRHTFLPKVLTERLEKFASVPSNAPTAAALNVPNIPAPLPAAPRTVESQPAVSIVAALPATPTSVSSVNTTLNSFLTASNAQKYDGTTYVRYNLYKQPGFTDSYIEIPTAPWLNTNGVIDPITETSNHELLQTITTFVSGGVEYSTTSSAKINPIISIGLQNSFYNGSKMTSADFNINSPDTYLGRPVVTITDTRDSWVPVNPNITASPNVDVNAAASATVNKDTSTVIHPDAQVD